MGLISLSKSTRGAGSGEGSFLTEGLAGEPAVCGQVGAVMGRAGAQSAQASALSRAALINDFDAMADDILARATPRCPATGAAAAVASADGAGR